MKKILACLLSMFLVVSFSGCEKNADTTSQISGFVTTEKVGNLPSEYTNSIIENELIVSGVKIADGYLVPTIYSENNCVTKYDLQGNMIWNKEYSITPKDSDVTNSIVPAPDGGFVLGVTGYTHQDSDGTWVTTDPVVAKCDEDGNLLWSKSYEGFSDTTLIKIFCSSNGDVITIGYTETKETKTVGVVSPGNIYISMLDNDGNLINENYYGGPEFDSLYDAEYIEGIGIVAVINENPASVVAVFDLSLQLSWEKNFKGYLYNNSITLYGDNIYVLETNNGNDILNKIDLNGNVIFAKDLGNSDCTGIIKGSSKGVLLKYDDKLLLLAADGKEKLEIPFDSGDVDKIIECNNYFLVISTKITGNLPQPLEVNMTWHSTELVYGGYNYMGKLLWKEAFDNTPEMMKSYDPDKNTDWTIR